MRRRGFSLIEAVVALAIILTLAAVAAPSLLAARDDARARSAADHLESLFHLARLEALKRNVNVAVRFLPTGNDYLFAMHADGNGNGVRTTEAEAGVDVQIRPAEALGRQFPRVRFALDQGVAAIDADAGGGDPVRFGRSQMASFSPLGTSSSGTVYLLGEGRSQFAVRVLGPTGRIRVFQYHYPSGEWRAR